MQIQLESTQPHSIQAYTDQQLQINALCYAQSVIVSRKEIISNLTIKTVDAMDSEYLALLLRAVPHVVIIGHAAACTLPPMDIVAELSRKRIGIECMSIDAACRTYNLLLSEDRAVVLGIIRNE